MLAASFGSYRIQSHIYTHTKQYYNIFLTLCVSEITRMKNDASILDYKGRGNNTLPFNKVKYDGPVNEITLS